MTDLTDAFNGINGAIETLCTPLLEDNTINEIIIGGRQRGAPTPPSLGIIPGEMTIDDTSMGSTGQREAWNYEIRLRGLYKEIGDTRDGFSGAVDIVSKARNNILAERQLGIPTIVRQIDSDKIMPVPFPIKYKKLTLYAADTVFKILLYITND